MGLRDILDAAADGPWDWMGGYPQRVTNGGADLVAEVFDNPDSPPGTVRLIALAPELASLCLDMGEELRYQARFDDEDCGDADCGYCKGPRQRAALLARLDQLGREPSDG